MFLTFPWPSIPIQLDYMYSEAIRRITEIGTRISRFDRNFAHNSPALDRSAVICPRKRLFLQQEMGVLPCASLAVSRVREMRTALQMKSRFSTIG